MCEYRTSPAAYEMDVPLLTVQTIDYAALVRSLDQHGVLMLRNLTPSQYTSLQTSGRRRPGRKWRLEVVWRGGEEWWKLAWLPQ